MLYRQMLELFDMLDRPQACGEEVKKLMLERGADEVTVHTVEGTDDNGKKGTTDCICILVKGKNGKSSGGTAPTMASLAGWAGWAPVPK